MTKLEPKKLNNEDCLLINNKTFDEERSLYGISGAIVSQCTFKGPQDGESPLKETSDIVVENSSFELRYALWHTKHTMINKVTFLSSARAPFWYDNDVEVTDSKIECVKVFRECSNIFIDKSNIVSEEPFWKCKNTNINESTVDGFYAFLESNHVSLNKVEFTGKYSFQYNKCLSITDSNLNTKDAFWHCKNVVVKNSTIKGEYIGWYSKNMTFINCVIESHQPFCYAKNIKLIDCKMPNCDLCFENSTVKGNVIGRIDSIKNPIYCNLVVDEVGELIKKSPIHKIKFNIKQNKR